MKMEYSVFKVEEKKDARQNLFGTGQVYINLGNVFARGSTLGGRGVVIF
jgi:hypothetical protein